MSNELRIFFVLKIQSPTLAKICFYMLHLSVFTPSVFLQVLSIEERVLSLYRTYRLSVRTQNSKPDTQNLSYYSVQTNIFFIFLLEMTYTEQYENH